MMRTGLLLIALVGTSGAALAATDPAPAEPRGIVFCQVPDLPDGRCQLNSDEFMFPRRPRTARICSLIPAAPNGQLRNLTEEFVAAIYPTISCDGMRILFAAKRNDRDNWDVWEMNVDGSGLRRITRDSGDCINPCYLPNGRILFCSSRSGARDEYDKDYAKQMFVCDLDGGNLTQISFNLSSESYPTVLRDGRILFTSWQHHGNHMGEAGVFALFACNPDGTVMMPFFGNQPGEGGAIKGMAQQLPDGRVVYVEVAGRAGYLAGALAALDPADPYRTFTLISRGQIDYSGAYAGGRFTSPWPLPDGRMLCAFTPGRATTVKDEGFPENPHLGIYWFDFATGGPGRLIFDDPRAQDLWPLAIMPRPVPPVIPSLVQPGRKTGTLLCVNPYLSDRKPVSKSVTIGQLPPAQPGEVKAVRVIEGFGNTDHDYKHHAGFVTQMGLAGHGTSNTASSFEQKRIIGYAPAEADGSFHIEVPADTTLHLQVLDENGMAIETQLTWIWVRPAERRFCVGCHESRETALTNLDCLAMRRAVPHFVAPAPEARRTVDFRRDIMPIIQRRCAVADCHDAASRKGDLDLGGGMDLVYHRERKAAYFNRAYESLLEHTGGYSLMGRLVEPGAARHSPLIWRLFDKQLGISDPRVDYRWPEKPTPHKPFLTDEERKLFVEWVDIGAQWDNIPGDDEFPGYDRDQSRQVAMAADEAAKQTFADPTLAFETRCSECHHLVRVKSARSRLRTEEDWRALIGRMDQKKPGWIRESERPLIAGYVLERYQAVSSMAWQSEWLRLFRLLPSTSLPSAVFSRNGSKPGEWPPNDPCTNKAWLWADRNGDGDFQADEFEAIAPGNIDVMRAFFLDDAGTVWIGEQRGTLHRFPLDAGAGKGGPLYSVRTRTTTKVPDDITNVRFVRYVAATDTMYLATYSKANPMQTWYPMAREIRRYDRWSTDRQHAWTTAIPYRFSDNRGRDIQPIAMDVAGDYVFVAYDLGAGDEHRFGEVAIFRAADGRREGSVWAGPEVGGRIGAIDFGSAVHAHRRPDGTYVILVEDDEFAKIVHYLWRPGAAAAR